MTTKYEELPDTICALLSADAWFAASGLTAYLDAAHFFPAAGASVDTIAEQARAAYDVLCTKGMIVSVESWAAGQRAQSGVTGFLVSIPRVIVMEVPNVNRSTAGFNLRPAFVCRKILSALLGQPTASPSQQRFQLPDAGSVFEPYVQAGARYEYPIRLQITTNIN
jgi:hypothetical protein